MLQCKTPGMRIAIVDESAARAAVIHEGIAALDSAARALTCALPRSCGYSIIAALLPICLIAETLRT